MNPEKAKLRQEVQKRLDSIGETEYKNLSEIVRDRVVKLIGEISTKQSIQSVLSFHAATRWKEIDVKPLENQFNNIDFDYVDLDINAQFPTKKYDMILIPVYGFNDDNYRLGHGAGWYDRLLANNTNSLSVGVGLQAGRVNFKQDSHDIPLNHIITD